MGWAMTSTLRILVPGDCSEELAAKALRSVGCQADLSCHGGEKDKLVEGELGVATEGEACERCACACRSSDVWAAYRVS